MCIHAYRSTFRVTKMCQVLQTSRSGYYAWRDRHAERQEQIQRIFAQSRERYGSPKITAVLRHTREWIAQKTVARIMRGAGLRSRVMRKYKATTHSRHSHPIADNVLNREFVAEWPKDSDNSPHPQRWNGFHVFDLAANFTCPRT